jgi:hypothetical protein
MQPRKDSIDKMSTLYAGKCHLCQEARQALLPKYPEYLVPEQHYRLDDAGRSATTTGQAPCSLSKGRAETPIQ